MRPHLLIAFLSIQVRYISSRFHSPADGVDIHQLLAGASNKLSISPETESSGPSQSSSEHGRAIQHRRQDEVEKLDSFRCLLTTSLGSKRYVSNSGARGIMFLVESTSDAELLSLEFAVGIDAPASIDVQVYYREGSFSGFNGKPQDWIQVADTQAQVSPDARTAIVPAGDFRVIEMKANTEYALYLSLQAWDVLKVHSSLADIGEIYDTDGILQRKVGVLLNEGPFPPTLGDGEAAEFEGVLHYKSPQTCTDIVATTDVKMEFAINDDPTDSIMSGLSQAVNEAMAAILVLDPILGSYKTSELLGVREVSTGFTGRSEEKCPSEYEKCSLVTSTITLQHLQSVESGTLRRHVLSNAQRLEDAIRASGEAVEDFAYVGQPVVDSRFQVIFVGPSEPMVAIQTRYFERVSSQFVQQFVEGPPVYEVAVFEEETEGDSTDDESRNLRGSNRQLQGALRIVVSVFGGGTEDELKDAVLASFNSNQDRYITELQLQQLRPGEINENEYGSIFGAISDMRINPWSPQSANTSTATTTDTKISQLWMPISIVGVVISSLWLLYRMYQDCRSDSRTMMEKLEDEKLEEGVHNPPDHENDDDVEQAPAIRESFEELPPIPSRGRALSRSHSMDAASRAAIQHQNKNLAASVNTADRNRRMAPNRSISIGGRPRSLDRLSIVVAPKSGLSGSNSIGPMPESEAPVNTACRNGRMAPGRSISIGGRPRSLDRLSIGVAQKPGLPGSNSIGPLHESEAPVNTAGRNGQMAPGRSISFGGRPRSLDRPSVGLRTKPALSPNSSICQNGDGLRESTSANGPGAAPNRSFSMKGRPRSLDRLSGSARTESTRSLVRPNGRGTRDPTLTAPVNPAPSRNTSARERPRSLDRLPIRASSIRSLPVGDSNVVQKIRSRPPSLDRLFERKNPRPSNSLSSSASVPAVPALSSTTSKRGKRPPSLDRLLKSKNPSSSMGLSSNASVPPEATTPKANFSETEIVLYRGTNGTEKAKIEKVHLDDSLVPFYTIRLLESDREKQTDDAHLEAQSAPVAVSKYDENQLVFYKDSDGLKLAEVMKIHFDEDQVPQYEVQFQENKEERNAGEAQLMGLGEAAIANKSATVSPISVGSSSSSRRQPIRGMKPARSMEGLATMRKPSRVMGSGAHPKRTTLELQASSSHSSSSSRRQPIRAMKPARGMEGLATMRKPSRVMGSGVLPKRTAPELQSSSSHSSSSSRRQPTRGMKPARSMEGLAAMRKPAPSSEASEVKSGSSDSSTSREPRRGVRKARSMENLLAMKKPPSSMISKVLHRKKEDNATAIKSTDSGLASSSGSREPVRGVKKTRSMEGLATMIKPKHFFKGVTMHMKELEHAVEHVDSSGTSKSDQSESWDPSRGVRKSRSMDGLSSMKKPNSSKISKSSLEFGIEKSASREKLSKGASEKPLTGSNHIPKRHGSHSPMRAGTQRPKSRSPERSGKYDWSKKKRYWDDDSSEEETEASSNASSKPAELSLKKVHGSDHTSTSKQKAIPTRGMTKTRSMGELYNMRKHGSSMSSTSTPKSKKKEPERGVLKTRSMEGLKSTKRQVSPLTASNRRTHSRGKYDWSKKKRVWDAAESESESESDFNSDDSSAESDFREEKVSLSLPKAGQKIHRIEDGSSSSEESDFNPSDKCINGDFEVTLKKQKKKKSKSKSKKTKNSNHNEESDSDSSISVEKSSKKTKKKKKRKKFRKKTSSSDTELKIIRGRHPTRIPDNQDAIRSISMDGTVTTTKIA